MRCAGKIMQLKIEEAALQKESDKLSQEHLEEIRRNSPKCATSSMP